MSECLFASDCSFNAENCYVGPGCLIGGNHTLLDSFIRTHVIETKEALYVWRTDSGWYCQQGERFMEEEKFRASLRDRYGFDSRYERIIDKLKAVEG